MGPPLAATWKQQFNTCKVKHRVTQDAGMKHIILRGSRVGTAKRTLRWREKLRGFESAAVGRQPSRICCQSNGALGQTLTSDLYYLRNMSSNSDPIAKCLALAFESRRHHTSMRTTARSYITAMAALQQHCGSTTLKFPTNRHTCVPCCVHLGNHASDGPPCRCMDLVSLETFQIHWAHHRLI